MEKKNFSNSTDDLDPALKATGPRLDGELSTPSRSEAMKILVDNVEFAIDEVVPLKAVADSAQSQVAQRQKYVFVEGKTKLRDFMTANQFSPPPDDFDYDDYSDYEDVGDRISDFVENEGLDLEPILADASPTPKFKIPAIVDSGEVACSVLLVQSIDGESVDESNFEEKLAKGKCSIVAIDLSESDQGSYVAKLAYPFQIQATLEVCNLVFCVVQRGGE